MKNKMHYQKSVLSKYLIQESSATKCALTNAAKICHCCQNGRYFYKTQLATLCIAHVERKPDTTKSCFCPTLLW